MFWPLFFLSYDLRIMIIPLVSSNSRPLCCLSYDLRIIITPLVSSNSRPLCYLSYDVRIMITPLVSSNSRPLCFLSYDYPFGVFKFFLSISIITSKKNLLRDSIIFFLQVIIDML
jgi:hypothetical protein